MSYVIFLHGTSSSGKSTLAREIQARSDVPFWHFASDQFVEVGMLPKRINDGGSFDWSHHRPKFFKAFHYCIESVLKAGNNIILEHIIENKRWHSLLQEILTPYDMFFVGVHCPVATLRKREETRGDRSSGEAEFHLKHVHSYAEYDFEIDTSMNTNEINAQLVLDEWVKREESSFFTTKTAP